MLTQRYMGLLLADKSTHRPSVLQYSQELTQRCPPQVAIKSSVGVFYFSDTLPLGAVHAAGLPPNPKPFTINTRA